jgi:hypothetical protein
VTVSELRDYVANQVEIRSQGQQKPSGRAENIGLNFTSARTHLISNGNPALDNPQGSNWSWLAGAVPNEPPSI